MVATKEHCYHCFSTLAASISPSSSPSPPTSFPNEAFPLFISWKKNSTILRGCIGTFSPLPLHTGLANYTLISALKDTRFQPITHAELPLLTCHVSLLVDFEVVDAWDDWKIGTHGIRITYTQHGQSLNATYLPEVAQDQVRIQSYIT
jgi:uncharacterized protein (TIGR00296 family)